MADHMCFMALPVMQKFMRSHIKRGNELSVILFHFCLSKQEQNLNRNHLSFDRQTLTRSSFIYSTIIQSIDVCNIL